MLFTILNARPAHKTSSMCRKCAVDVVYTPPPSSAVEKGVIVFIRSRPAITTAMHLYAVCVYIRTCSKFLLLVLYVCMHSMYGT